ncbi:hypothetical protein AB4084_07155, partial [Lysobacter sp. 2RAB21]
MRGVRVFGARISAIAATTPDNGLPPPRRPPGRRHPPAPPLTHAAAKLLGPPASGKFARTPAPLGRFAAAGH